MDDAKLEERALVLDVVLKTKHVISLYKAYYQLKKEAMQTELQIIEHNQKFNENERKDAMKTLGAYEEIIKEYEQAERTFDFANYLKIEKIKASLVNSLSQPNPEIEKLQVSMNALHGKLDAIEKLATNKMHEIQKYQTDIAPTLPEDIFDHQEEVVAKITEARKNPDS